MLAADDDLKEWTKERIRLEEGAFIADEDEEMEDLDRLCVRIRVEEMEQEDVAFAWGEEYLAHMEIDGGQAR